MRKSRKSRRQLLLKIGYTLIEVMGVNSKFSVPLSKFTNEVLGLIISGDVVSIGCNKDREFFCELSDGRILYNIIVVGRKTVHETCKKSARSTIKIYSNH